MATGTLIFSSQNYPAEVLGTSLTEEQAIATARSFLADNYETDTWDISHIGEYFRNGHTHQLRALGKSNQYDVPRFRWLSLRP